MAQWKNRRQTDACIWLFSLTNGETGNLVRTSRIDFGEEWSSSEFEST